MEEEGDNQQLLTGLKAEHTSEKEAVETILGLGPPGEVTSIESLCVNCEETGTTRLMV